MKPWYTWVELNLLLTMVNLLLAQSLTSLLKGEVVMLLWWQGHSPCVNLLVLV